MRRCPVSAFTDASGLSIVCCSSGNMAPPTRKSARLADTEPKNRNGVSHTALRFPYNIVRGEEQHLVHGPCPFQTKLMTSMIAHFCFSRTVRSTPTRRLNRIGSRRGRMSTRQSRRMRTLRESPSRYDRIEPVRHAVQITRILNMAVMTEEEGCGQKEA